MHDGVLEDEVYSARWIGGRLGRIGKWVVL
jgi:hypothetical protein